MKNTLNALFVLICIVMLGTTAFGQSTVFTDDFNRGSVVQPITNGGTPTMTYATTTTSTGSPSPTGATSRTNLLSGSDYALQILSGNTGATPTPQTAGRTYVWGPLSTFASPFTSTLRNNVAPVTWTFNMRTNRTTALSGLAANSYAVVCVLAASDSLTKGNGYAVVEFRNGNSNSFKLVRYSGGLIADGNLTSIVAPATTADTLPAKTSWASIKVEYSPSGDVWKFYYRSDGTSPADPASGSYTQMGTNVTDSTYTKTSLPNFGFFFNHSAGSTPTSNTAYYDNFKVTVAVGPTSIAQLTNGIATSPLTSGTTDKAILGFSLTSATGTPNFTALNVNTSSTSVNKFTNIKLYTSTDNDYSTAGNNTQVSSVTVTQTTGQIQLSGFTEALSSTAKNFFLVADIGGSVNGLTANVQPSFTEADLTVSAGSKNSATMTGTNYAFVAANPATIVTTGTLTDFGTVAVGNTSSEQNYSVSGTYLLDTLKVTAPTGFQVSLVGSGSGFGSSVFIIPSSGTVSSTPIYVRFQPVSPGAASGNIANASVTATTQNVAVSGTGAATEPNTQATNILFSTITANSMIVSWTNGDGSSRMLVGHAGTAVDANPVDLTSYAADSAFGGGSEIGTGNRVLYAGSGSSVHISGLNASTIYHYRVYEYNGSGGTSNFDTAIATGNPASEATLAAEPSLQATNITFSLISSTSLKVNFLKGDGAKRIVVAKATGAVLGSPADGVSYAASAAFGGADSIATSEYVVYNDTGSSVTVTGLMPATMYHFRVFEYNSASPANYLISSGTGNPASQTTYATEPSSASTSMTFSAISGNTITVHWINGSGPNRIVVAKAGSAVGGTPSDGTAYTAGAAFGGADSIATGEYVVYNGAGDSVAVTALISGTTYHYAVFEYDGSGATANYLATSLTGSQPTTSYAAPTVTSPTATSIGTTTATLGANVTSDGNDPLTERGIVWATSPNPTTLSNKVIEGNTTTGSFTVPVLSLPNGTLIYYRGYAINNTGTGYTSDGTFYTLKTEPTSHVSSFTATAMSSSSIDLSWSVAAGADGYLIIRRSGSNPTGTPSDGNPYSIGNIIGDGTVAAVIPFGATVATTIGSLSPGTRYNFSIIPFAWDGANAATYNYYIAPAIPTANAVTFSVMSDVISTPSFVYPTNIPYANYPPTAGLTTGNSIAVFGLRVRDGGASAPDSDVVPTELVALSLTGTNLSVIDHAALFDGTTNIAEVAVSGSSISFSGLSVSAPDNGTRDITLRVVFKNTVTDHTQFLFAVSSVTAGTTSSGFATGNGGGAASSTSGSDNTIAVTATALVFTTQPQTGKEVNVNFGPVLVEARDANGNTDLDFLGAVTLSSTAFASLASTDVGGLTKNAGFGYVSWTNLTSPTAGTGTIIASASGVSPGTSNSITVNPESPLLVENFDYTALSLLSANANFNLRASGGTYKQTIATVGLTYPGYAGSAIGLSDSLTLDGDDYSRDFVLSPAAGVNSGSVYLAALVKVMSAKSTGDFFLSFHYNNTFNGKVFAQGNGAGGFNFATGKNTVSTYESTARTFGTTYLVVLKYTFNTGSTTDDRIDMWVNPAIGGSEPSPVAPFSNITESGRQDYTNIGGAVIRQGASANAPQVFVDGIRMAKSWAVAVAGPSFASDIVAAGNETSNIDYASKQSSTINSTSDGQRVWSFAVRDGGASADADANVTELSSVAINQGSSNEVTNWSTLIRQATLFDGSTKVADATSIGSSSIAFTGLSGTNVTAADGGSKTLDLYLTFKTTATDDKQLQFQITNANAVSNPRGDMSQFSAFSTTSSSVAGDANRINVIANQLGFVQQPTDAAVNVSISPAVTVEAKDGNGNRDVEFATNIDITATGATLTGSPVSVAPAAGLATYSTLTFSTSGTGVTLTAAKNGGGWDVASNAFNITLTPLISVGSITGFGNQVVATPSSEKTYSVSAGNLTSNLIIKPPPSFEVSLTSGSGFVTSPDSITLTPSTGTVNPTTIYVRYSPLSANGANADSIMQTSAGAVAKSVLVNGNAISAEPATQSTITFGTVTANSIVVNFSGGNGTHRILVARSGSAVTYSPTDAVASSGVNNDFSLATDQGSGNRIVYDNTGGTVTVSNLVNGTTYYFAVYEYNVGTGTSQNYLISSPGTGNQATLTTSYTWNQSISNDWTVAGNWTPARSVPVATDIILFTGPGSFTASNIPAQTIGQMQVSGGAFVTLQAGAASNTLTIGGSTGTDLSVGASDSLNINGSNALLITLAAGSTGSVSGKMMFSGGAHKLQATDAGSLTFQTGSTFKTGTGFSSNAFGAVNINSVVFANGSVYVSTAGANPFGASAPASVVVWQAGSTYRHGTLNSPSLANRTYANFEFDTLGTSAFTSSSPVTVDSLIVSSGTLGIGIKANFTVKGNINVKTGAALNLNPTTAGTMILGGSTAQLISGAGTLSTNSFQAVTVNNAAGVILDRDVAVSGGTLTFTSGNVTTGTNTLTVTGTVSRTSGHVVGKLQKSVGTGAAVQKFFEVGDASSYTPVSVAFGNVFGSGNLLASTTPGSHPNLGTSGLNPSKKLNRYYTLTNTATTFDSANVVFNFVPGDIDAGADTANFAVKKYSGGSWSSPSTVNKLSKSIQANAISSFSDFAIGEPATVVYYGLHLTTVGSGVINKVPDQVTYASGSTVELTAVPNPHNHFVHWSQDTSGSANPITVTMNAEKNITATFAIDTLTITATASAHGSISPSGAVKVQYGGNQSFTIAADPTYHIDSVVVDGVNQGAIGSYPFSNVQSNHTIAAYFSNDRTLTVDVVGHGSVDKNPDQATYTHGTIVQLTASPDRGWLFSAWSGDAIGATSPVSITMDGDKSVTATFVVDPAYATKYRTATAFDWATSADAKGKLKSIKHKADKVFFKRTIVSPAGATGFTLKFNMASRGRVYSSVAKTDTLIPVTPWDSVKKVTYNLLVLSGATFQIEGRGLMGKPFEVSVVWATLPRATTVSYKKDAPGWLQNFVGMPLPNLQNVAEELFPKGFGQVSSYYSSLHPMYVGILKGGDNPNSVKLQKYADMQKSLIKRSRTGDLLHFKDARCLNLFDKNLLPDITKPMKKQVINLAPDKHNNKLFAEVVALKLNIAASIVNKFPNGFGELTYNDLLNPSDPFNNLLVNTIAAKADSALSCVGVGITPAELYDVVLRLNRAFRDTTFIDTNSFAAKTSIKGARQLADAPFLHKTPGIVPLSLVAPPVADEFAVPTIYTLRQNYPNPFNPSTTIQFALANPAVVSLKIYNLLGQEIATLIDRQSLDEGEQQVEFDAGNLASGVYFYRMVAEQIVNEEDGIPSQTFSSVKKMMLVK